MQMVAGIFSKKRKKLSFHFKWLRYKLFKGSLDCQNEGKKMHFSRFPWTLWPGLAHRGAWHFNGFDVYIFSWYTPRCQEGRSWSNAKFLLYSLEREEDHSLPGDGGESLRAPLSLSNMLSIISKHHFIKQHPITSVSHNPNQNYVRLFKKQEETSSTPFLAAWRVWLWCFDSNHKSLYCGGKM